MAYIASDYFKKISIINKDNNTVLVEDILNYLDENNNKYINSRNINNPINGNTKVKLKFYLKDGISEIPSQFFAFTNMVNIDVIPSTITNIAKDAFCGLSLPIDTINSLNSKLSEGETLEGVTPLEELNEEETSKFYIGTTFPENNNINDLTLEEFEDWTSENPKSINLGLSSSTVCYMIVPKSYNNKSYNKIPRLYASTSISEDENQQYQNYNLSEIEIEIDNVIYKIYVFELGYAEYKLYFIDDTSAQWDPWETYDENNN